MNFFEKLTSENVRAEGAKGILILPVGSVEQHGPHLPLAVDTEIPLRVASALAARIHGFVAPAICYGARSLPQSGGAPDLAGTVHVRGGVLTEFLKDVIGGYLRSGFRSIVILNGHYENESFLFEALELCREEGKLDGARVIALSWWSLVQEATLDKIFGGKFPGWHAEHASAPPRAGIYFFPVEPSKISNRGVLGSASVSSGEIGAALYEEICAQLETLVRQHMG